VPLANDPPVPGHGKLAPRAKDPHEAAQLRAFVGRDYAPDRILDAGAGVRAKRRKQPFFLYYPSPLPHLAPPRRPHHRRQRRDRPLADRALHRDGRYRVVTLDLSPLPEKYRPLCLETYAGNILDRYLLDQLAAHHEIEAVFHLAALLSTRGERDPELAHQINVEGTLHLLRMAQSLTLRLGTGR
jgi:hypothetical protein